MDFWARKMFLYLKNDSPSKNLNWVIILNVATIQGAASPDTAAGGGHVIAFCWPAPHAWWRMEVSTNGILNLFMEMMHGHEGIF